MIEFDPILVHEWLRFSAKRVPQKTALVADNKRLSYAELDNESDRFAQGLMKIGVQRHDRVAVYLDEPSNIVIALYGILKAGAAFVIINTSTKSRKLGYILENSAARALIADTSRLPTVQNAVETLQVNQEIIWTGNNVPSEGHSWNQLQEPSTSDLPWPRIIDIDLSALIYTSGSTGEPKGVVSTHHNMISAARSIIQYIDNRHDDVILNVLPLSFDYGLYQVIMSVMFGGTIILEKSFAFPHLLLKRISEEQVTGFPLVPTIAAMLLQMQDLNAYDLTSLRYLTNTGSVFPPDHIRRIRELMPEAKVFSMYGLTECKRTTFLPPEALDHHADSVGIAIPNCEVIVLREDGTNAQPGEPGELVIRGSNVMQGYWNEPEMTDNCFRKGAWRADVHLHSGDTFQQDEGGYLYFLARQNDMIKSRGERISAKEVEYTLCEIEGVAEAAVIGVPDEILGQALMAFIVTGKHCQLSEATVKKFCMGRVESFMVPKFIEFVPALPKNQHGKIDKKRLSTQVS